MAYSPAPPRASSPLPCVQNCLHGNQKLGSDRTPAPPRAALGAAENLLAAECGPELVIALRPHYAALLSVADLALGNPNLRVFLRHVGELHRLLRTAEMAAQHWRSQCSAKEELLVQAHSQIETLRNQVAHDRRHAEGRVAHLQAEARSHEDTGSEYQMAHGRLEAELERCQAEILRMGAKGIAQSQALASEQAAMLACSQEINRLRIELEVTGTMGRQNAAALEAARRHAANADLTAEHASHQQVRLEALLKHATKEQHSELVHSTEAATAEAARLRARVDNNKGELYGVRRALVAQEAQWAELQSISPCVVAVVRFLLDTDGPAAKAAQEPAPTAGGYAPMKMPVLALRWRPGAYLNTTPTWKAIQTGLIGFFHQLQSGSILPEQVELTVCCADGHWFCAREEEDIRFAALLMYQALHRDAPVMATCRIGSVHALMNKPMADLAQTTGLSIRSTGALWRAPPLNEEDFFRGLMIDSPLREVVEEFFYHRRRSRVEDALREEARRDPRSIALVDAGVSPPLGWSNAPCSASSPQDATGSAPTAIGRAPTADARQVPLAPPPVPAAVPMSRPRAVI